MSCGKINKSKAVLQGSVKIRIEDIEVLLLSKTVTLSQFAIVAD